MVSSPSRNLAAATWDRHAGILRDLALNGPAAHRHVYESAAADAEAHAETARAAETTAPEIAARLDRATSATAVADLMLEPAVQAALAALPAKQRDAIRVHAAARTCALARLARRRADPFAAPRGKPPPNPPTEPSRGAPVMATTNFVLIPPTGILAAIEDHRVAWSAYQNVTEDSEADELALIELHEALDRLVGTPCRSMDETQALAAHLFWYVNAERHTRDWTSSPDSGALARAADLALLLRDDPATVACDPPHLTLGQFVARVVQRVAPASSIVSLDRQDRDLRLADVPEPIEPWCFGTPVRPDTPHVRALRVVDTLGEAFAALVIVAGGAIATGLATLL